jgi:RNase H-fold protein (predicted Holliday junction resolvase)
MTTTLMYPTILGIDPGTKEMGLAVLRGRDLLGYGVHTLRNGERPHDVIGQAKRIVLAYIAKYEPQVVAIERPLPIPTKRAALLSVIAQELHERARELALEIRVLSPAQVREVVVGDPRATKIETAEAALRIGFEELRAKLPKRPARAALGLRPGDRYWLHVFDALALAVAVERTQTALRPCAG